MARKGMGTGMGKGYRNLIKVKDSKVHQDAGKGVKQPQRVWIPNYYAPYSEGHYSTINEFQKGDIVRAKQTGLVGKVVGVDNQGVWIERLVDGKPKVMLSERTAETWEKVEPEKIKPKRIHKTKIEFAVQGNYGSRWEDVTAEDKRSEARARLKEYNENESYPHRIITRRIKNPQYKGE